MRCALRDPEFQHHQKSQSEAVAKQVIEVGKFDLHEDSTPCALQFAISALNRPDGKLRPDTAPHVAELALLQEHLVPLGFSEGKTFRNGMLLEERYKLCAAQRQAR